MVCPLSCGKAWGGTIACRRVAGCWRGPCWLEHWPAGRARAETWPDKPVRIIVPFPPGQAADIFTRLYADELSRRWPQRVVVRIAAAAPAPRLEAGARAAPDGYTLTAGTSGTLGVNPSVLPRIPYDAEHDFAFICNVVVLPLLIVAHPCFPG